MRTINNREPKLGQSILCSLVQCLGESIFGLISPGAVFTGILPLSTVCKKPLRVSISELSVY